MAAVTVLTPSPGGPWGGLFETVAITNQTAASTAVLKAIAVPDGARYATFVLGGITLGGTTPTLDFKVEGYNAAANSFAAPDDGHLFMLGAGWDGITQITAGSGHELTIHIGPDITTDDTGSATAACAYGIGAPLPGYLVYTYTTTDAADDADYALTISVYFRRA